MVSKRTRKGEENKGGKRRKERRSCVCVCEGGPKTKNKNENEENWKEDGNIMDRLDYTCRDFRMVDNNGRDEGLRE